jgi:hypothetical protein
VQLAVHGTERAELAPKSLQLFAVSRVHRSRS